MSKGIIIYESLSINCYSKAIDDFKNFLEEDIISEIENLNNFFLDVGIKKINIDEKAFDEIKSFLKKEGNIEKYFQRINECIENKDEDKEKGIYFYKKLFLDKINLTSNDDLYNIDIAVINHSNPLNEIGEYKNIGEKKLRGPTKINSLGNKNGSSTIFDKIDKSTIILHYITDEGSNETSYTNLSGKIVAISLVDDIVENSNNKEITLKSFFWLDEPFKGNSITTTRAYQNVGKYKELFYQEYFKNKELAEDTRRFFFKEFKNFLIDYIKKK